MADFGADDIPHARKGKLCPLLKEDMSKVCHDCGWWLGIQWTDPTTQEVRSKWNCALVTNSLTNIDVTRSMAGVDKSVQQCTNEMVKRAVSPPVWAVREIVRVEMDKHDKLQVQQRIAQEQHRLEMENKQLAIEFSEAH